MPEGSKNYESLDAIEARNAAAAKKRADSADAKSKFQGFTAGGEGKVDPGAPKRSDFPEGLAGQAGYTKALKDYNATKKQSDSLAKARE